MLFSLQTAHGLVGVVDSLWNWTGSAVWKTPLSIVRFGNYHDSGIPLMLQITFPPFRVKRFTKTD